MDWPQLINLFKEYGALGLAIVAVYILLNSKFTIKYPKDQKPHK